MPYRFISNRAGAAPYHNGRMREPRSLCCCQLCQMPATRVRSRNQYYNMCLSQVQQQRTEPEPIPGKPQQFPHRCEPLVAIDPDNGLRFDLMGPTGSALALVRGF